MHIYNKIYHFIDEFKESELEKIGLKNISLQPCFFFNNISLKLCDDPINRKFFLLENNL